LTCQIFDGRFRRPVDGFAVRNLVLGGGVLAVQHVDELGMVGAGYAGDAAGSGMFVTMMEYRQPVAGSTAVRFLACRRDGLVRRTIQRSPAGQPAARDSRWVISATCSSCCTTPLPGVDISRPRENGV